MLMSAIVKEIILAYHWDVERLLSMGVKEEYICQLTPREAKDLLKGLLYLHAKYQDSKTQ